jgi:hypothetical protein
MLTHTEPSASEFCPGNSFSASKISSAGTGMLFGFLIVTGTANSNSSWFCGGGEPSPMVQPMRSIRSVMTCGQ